MFFPFLFHIKRNGNKNLRASPDANSEILAVIPAGGIVTVLGETSVGDTIWYNVTYNGAQGWISQTVTILTTLTCPTNVPAPTFLPSTPTLTPTPTPSLSTIWCK
jgi:hypothetical protein